jgi:hypothetical protein
VRGLVSMLAAWLSPRDLDTSCPEDGIWTGELFLSCPLEGPSPASQVGICTCHLPSQPVLLLSSLHAEALCLLSAETEGSRPPFSHR